MSYKFNSNFINTIVDECVIVLEEKERKYQEVKTEILESKCEKWVSKIVYGIFESIIRWSKGDLKGVESLNISLTKSQIEKVNSFYNRLGREITEEIIDNLVDSKLGDCFTFDYTYHNEEVCYSCEVKHVDIIWEAKREIDGNGIGQGRLLELLRGER